MIKYTREELMKMPLKIVRGLDIRTADEEKLIQGVVNARAAIAQPIISFPEIIPDIKNSEQEKEWQSKIDKFNLENTPVEARIADAEKKLEAVKTEVVSEIVHNIPKVEVPIVVPTVVTVQNGQIIKPFCDSCTSKGVRHKKECPTLKQNADINTETIQHDGKAI